MGWAADNSGFCDTCGKTGPGHRDHQVAVQMLRALGWHHGEGVTMGGQRYEALLCTGCARDEHRRKRSIQQVEQDAFPIDWDTCRVVERGQGSQTR